MGLHKILKIVALLLSVAGIIFLAMIVSKGDDAVRATGDGVDGFLYVAYIMFAIVLLFVLVFVLKGIAAGNIKKTLMTIGAFLLIVIISYVMAEGVETTMRDGDILSASGSKWVSTGLNTFYILAFLAIGAMVFSGIKKVTK
jgi:Na+/proline symporter